MNTGFSQNMISEARAENLNFSQSPGFFFAPQNGNIPETRIVVERENNYLNNISEPAQFSSESAQNISEQAQFSSELAQNISEQAQFSSEPGYKIKEINQSVTANKIKIKYFIIN